MSLYIYWQLAVWLVIFLTCVQWSLFGASPLRQGRMWTLITQILWHMEIYIITMRLVYLPIQLSILPCSLSLLPSSSFLFLAVCAVIGRSFVIQQIPSSNLFMVVVDNKCDCSMFEPITMDPIEIMYILHWPESWEVGVIEHWTTVCKFLSPGILNERGWHKDDLKARELHLTGMWRLKRQHRQENIDNLNRKLD